MGNLATAKAITFFDVETTGLDPTRSAILQISIVTDWENGTQDSWSTKIKPRDVELKFANEEALKICKYNEADWSDAPMFEDVAETIAKKIAWGPVVGHNIQFDIAHINASLDRRAWRPVNLDEKFDASNHVYKIGYPAIDTCGLAYLYLPTERQNLNALREYFDIDKDRAHDAVTDVEDCRTVFYKIISDTTSS